MLPPASTNGGCDSIGRLDQEVGFKLRPLSLNHDFRVCFRHTQSRRGGSAPDQCMAQAVAVEGQSRLEIRHWNLERVNLAYVRLRERRFHKLSPFHLKSM
jgi:hypothetical protein